MASFWVKIPHRLLGNHASTTEPPGIHETDPCSDSRPGQLELCIPPGNDYWLSLDTDSITPIRVSPGAGTTGKEMLPVLTKLFLAERTGPRLGPVAGCCGQLQFNDLNHFHDIYF